MGVEKVLCNICYWHGSSEELLRAPNPFEVGEMIYACPSCKEIGQVVAACEEPGCWKEATCGTPIPNGYKRSCGKHVPVKGDE